MRGFGPGRPAIGDLELADDAWAADRKVHRPARNLIDNWLAVEIQAVNLAGAQNDRKWRPGRQVGVGVGRHGLERGLAGCEPDLLRHACRGESNGAYDQGKPDDGGNESGSCTQLADADQPQQAGRPEEQEDQARADHQHTGITRRPRDGVGKGGRGQGREDPPNWTRTPRRHR